MPISYLHMNYFELMVNQVLLKNYEIFYDKHLIIQTWKYGYFSTREGLSGYFSSYKLYN